MRIVCVSDTHLFHDEHSIEVPDGDMIVHAGDATFRGKNREIKRFNEWFSSLPHRYKVFVAGNHDWGFERNPSIARNLLSPSITYLMDREVTIEGFRIYGSPWQPRFFDWAFNLDRGSQLQAKWAQIPDGIDILITHGPPFGYGDLTLQGDRAGCEDLAKAMERVQPQLHVFGHIHPGHGQYRNGPILHVNASICDESYDPSQPPIVVDLERPRSQQGISEQPPPLSS
jgi:Icc-related predicted phosphoesterase